MTKTDEYGPDNPRPWDPNHQLLKSTAGPHETHGLLRMQRAGFKGKDIMEMFGIKALKLQSTLHKALDVENQAYHAGRDVYDGQKTDGKRT